MPRDLELSESATRRLAVVLGAIGDEAATPRPFDELSDDVPHVPASRPRGRHRVAVLAVLAALVSAAVVVAVWRERQGEGERVISESTDERTADTARSSIATTVAEAPSTTSTVAGGTPQATASDLRVHPDGVIGPDLRVYQRDIAVADPASKPGAVVLRYVLDVGWVPTVAGVLVPPATTLDGQLAISTDCPTGGCPVSAATTDEIHVSVTITVARTDQPLAEGEHLAVFEVRFEDGTTRQLDVRLLAEPPPRDLTDLVASSTGPPRIVQTVPDVGRFVYHAVAAFDSIWFLSKNSNEVVRVDAATGEITARIVLGESPSSQRNRLAVADDAILVAGTPFARIDPVTNAVEHVDGGPVAFGVTTDGETVWAVGFQGVQRIDPDGTITSVDVPDGRWFDALYLDGLVWIADQQRRDGRLLAIDAATDTIVHDITLPLGDDELVVRLAGDETTLVIGTDTTGGGGRSGRVLLLDPATGVVTDTITLPARPEGLALTPGSIWTSGAVIDRTTRGVTPLELGVTLVVGPDGSIWGSRAVPNNGSADMSAVRWAPGDAG